MIQGDIFKQFKESYLSAIREGGMSTPESEKQAEKNLATLYRLAVEETASPTLFGPYHERVRVPFDYYQFGLDFVRPLIKLPKSQVLGKENLHKILDQLSRNENAVLLANHQTEPDPQIISILLEKVAPQFAEEMIFVAGHRVTSDPLAIPFSKGRNLLCIYSKRYIEQPPEQKEEKTHHNRRSIEKLMQLLQQGGKCVYVAPSGGRDRIQEDGNIHVAPFDPSSIELFRLVAKGTKTHFYPFAMDTYALLPPPETTHTALSEKRVASAARVGISFGEEVDLDTIPDVPADKHLKRESRAHYLWNIVNGMYRKMQQNEG